MGPLTGSTGTGHKAERKAHIWESNFIELCEGRDFQNRVSIVELTNANDLGRHKVCSVWHQALKCLRQADHALEYESPKREVV